MSATFRGSEISSVPLTPSTPAEILLAELKGASTGEFGVFRGMLAVGTDNSYPSTGKARADERFGGGHTDLLARGIRMIRAKAPPGFNAIPDCLVYHLHMASCPWSEEENAKWIKSAVLSAELRVCYVFHADIVQFFSTLNPSAGSVKEQFGRKYARGGATVKEVREILDAGFTSVTVEKPVSGSYPFPYVMLKK